MRTGLIIFNFEFYLGVLRTLILKHKDINSRLIKMRLFFISDHIYTTFFYCKITFVHKKNSFKRSFQRYKNKSDSDFIRQIQLISI